MARFILRKGKLVPLRRSRPRESPGGHSSAAWPKIDKLCPPKQIPKMLKQFKKHGVSVEIDKKGNMKLEDRNHRKRVYEALGRFDYSAGMSGDPAPNGDHYAMQRESREQENFWQGIDEKVAAYERYFGIS